MQKHSTDNTLVFGKRNYIILIAGLLFMIVGYILMSGGGSDDPNVFNPEIFNFQRIRLAPLLIIIGFVIQLFAIFLPSKSAE
ncbi:MAG: DUF3098 domain-containing protein [Flavobacteriales bacterium]|nr:MAG: DUF3098 domain-containing protein [Flavobacteriales bacterium]